MNLRALSLAFSSAILLLALAASFILWLYWYILVQSRSWKTDLRHATLSAASIGCSISLLIFSLSGNTKICVIILLCFGRVLITGHIWFYWESLSLVLSKSAQWAILGFCVCCYGLSIFLVQEIAQDHLDASILKAGLASFGLELLGVSLLYTWLLCWLRRCWYKQYALLSALLISASGCMSAVIPFAITCVYPIDWYLALWVHVLVTSMWLGRAAIFGLCSLIQQRRSGSNSESHLDQIPPQRGTELRALGFDDL